MKVLQLNIWCGKLGKKIIDLVNTEDPEIVCFQEAMEFPGGRSFLFEDINTIIKKTGYKHYYFTPHLGYSLMKRKARMGLLILSKFPIIETESIYVKSEYKENFDLLDSDHNTQSLQRATVKCDSGLIHVLNYHGYHDHNSKNGCDETIRQCGFIANYVNNLSGKILLCGDFNLNPDSDSIKIIESVMCNHVTLNNFNNTRTNLTEKSGVSDYIFSKGNFENTSFKVLDEIASDHCALTFEFKE